MLKLTDHARHQRGFSRTRELCKSLAAVDNQIVQGIQRNTGYWQNLFHRVEPYPQPRDALQVTCQRSGPGGVGFRGSTGDAGAGGCLPARPHRAPACAAIEP